jgi:hypothetical protein
VVGCGWVGFAVDGGGFTSGGLGTSREMSRRREQTLFFLQDSVFFLCEKERLLICSCCYPVGCGRYVLVLAVRSL